MGLLDGNIFENMRLILPEHRRFMERADREAKKRKKPQLSQQKWDEMSYAITEAMGLQQEIRFVLFDPYEDEIWTGLPEMYAGALHVWVDTPSFVVKIPPWSASLSLLGILWD